MEFESAVPFSSGYSLKRSGSVELRGGKLYKSCDCIKRNGLQMDCRRMECAGRSCCMSANPSCTPGNSAQRMASLMMGIGGRSGSQGGSYGSSYGGSYGGNYSQNMGMSDMSSYGNTPGMMRNLSAQYAFGGIGDGNYSRSAGSDLMSYNTNYGGPPDAGSQFMPAPQASPYGACMPSSEGGDPSQYAAYGSSNEIPEMSMQGYGDYVQG